MYDDLPGAGQGLGTKESVLIEILCTRSSQQIREIVASYREREHSHFFFQALYVPP